MNRSKLFKKCLKEVNDDIKTFEDLKYAAELCLKQNEKIKENFYVRIRRETANKIKSKLKNKKNQKNGKKSGKKNAKTKGKDVNNNKEVVKCKNVNKSKNKVRIKRAGDGPDVIVDEANDKVDVVVDGDPCSDSEVGPLGSPLTGPLEQSDLGPDHVQVFWKHKCFGNISQLEIRSLIG